MSGASANSCVIRSPRLCGFHQRDEGDQRSNLSPCLLSASDPEFAYARGFYVWSPDSGVLPNFRCGINFVVNSRELRKYFKCLKTEFSIIFVYIPAILCYHIFEA